MNCKLVRVGSSLIRYSAPCKVNLTNFLFAKWGEGGLAALRNASPSKTTQKLSHNFKSSVKKRMKNIFQRNDTRCKRTLKLQIHVGLFHLILILIDGLGFCHSWTASQFIFIQELWGLSGPTSSWRLFGPLGFVPSHPSGAQAVWPTQVTTNQSPYILCGQSFQSWRGVSLGFRILPDNLPLFQP